MPQVTWRALPRGPCGRATLESREFSQRPPRTGPGPTRRRATGARLVAHQEAAIPTTPPGFVRSADTPTRHAPRASRDADGNSLAGYGLSGGHGGFSDGQGCRQSRARTPVGYRTSDVCFHARRCSRRNWCSRHLHLFPERPSPIFVRRFCEQRYVLELSLVSLRLEAYGRSRTHRLDSGRLDIHVRTTKML